MVKQSNCVMEKNMEFIKGIFRLLGVLVNAFIVLLLGAVILYFVYPIAIHGLFPGGISVLADSLSFKESICILLLFRLLLKGIA